MSARAMGFLFNDCYRIVASRSVFDREKATVWRYTEKFEKALILNVVTSVTQAHTAFSALKTEVIFSSETLVISCTVEAVSIVSG
jgi:hypothetical protein